jgi:hypothetical protein
MELILNEPVALPRHGGRGVRAVFWVRIYRDADSAVVIMADVPANPGPGPNALDTWIARHLLQKYLPDGPRVRWFFCDPGKHDWPRPSDKTRYYEGFFSGPQMDRTFAHGPGQVPRSEISEAIGRSLDLMPAHEEVLERVFAAGRRDCGQSQCADRRRHTAAGAGHHTSSRRSRRIPADPRRRPLAGRGRPARRPIRLTAPCNGYGLAGDPTGDGVHAADRSPLTGLLRLTAHVDPRPAQPPPRLVSLGRLRECRRAVHGGSGSPAGGLG